MNTKACRYSVLFFVAILLSIFLSLAFAQMPPQQPTSGPGSSDYKHARVIKNVYGEAGEQYWIFEPTEPKPISCPLIVFNHGWSGTNPKIYGAWIKHIVRRGNIVVYPVYQEPGKFRYPTRQITPNAIKAVKDVIAILQIGKHVKPELDKFAAVGHSAGGQITANMAALAGSSGLPISKAIMCVQQGKSWAKTQRMIIPLEDMSKIPASTLLLTVVGDQDRLARDIDAKRVFNESTQIPPANKDFVILVTDKYGKPALIANHFAPCAPDAEFDSGEKFEKRKRDGILRTKIKEKLISRRLKQQRIDDEDLPDLRSAAGAIDALDYYGLWKLFDGLCDAAFYGKNREYALGDTPQQRYMGKWSDGVLVKELIILKLRR